VRIAVLAVGVASVAVLLTACGGGGKTASTGQGTSNGMEAYYSCLQSHGVTVTRPSGGGSFGGGNRPSGQPNPSGVRPSGVRPSGVRPSGDSSRGPGGGGFNGVPSGVNPTTYASAQAACASVRPSFGGGGGNFGGGQGGDNGALAAYTNCLKNHGVTVTDINQLNTADPSTSAAMVACAALKPSANPTSS
jgi:hypothetical protein